MRDKSQLHIQYVPAAGLKPAEYNPRKHDQTAAEQLKQSIRRFGVVDPVIVNQAPGRENIVVGGHFRLEVLKELGYEEVPVVYVSIPEIEREKELNLRLNKNQGEFDLELLSEYDESFLADVGFGSEELDEIFEDEPNEQTFDLKKELDRLSISEITVQKGDVYDLDGSRLMCGDSTVEQDVLKLMGGEKADMVMTDPPYQISYLKGGKRHGEATVGFGMKKNRRYLETESLPDNFSNLWMSNVAKVQSENFSIFCYENWKNIRNVWDTIEKFWRVRNLVIWHLPNRNQGYAGKYKLFSKYDVAVLGTSEEYPGLNLEGENLLENEYEAAFFATSGSPHWEPYGKGKKYCPTDHIEFNAADEKSSGQSIVFGIKPLEILLPYIKILTKRGQLVLEPFGGSGSTLIASNVLGRRCFVMEKVPTYAEVIMNRWEKHTGKKRRKIDVAKQ